MKTLLLDIETSPNLGYIWEKYEQDVLAYTEEWFMLSFAVKWLGKKRTDVWSLPDFPMYRKDKHNDKDLVTKLHSYLNEADVVIAHNGDFFDIKKSNARFIFHKLPPPKPFKTIDTKKVAKRAFMFNSNKLDDLGKYFGVGRKLKHTGFELWLGCLHGDKKAWKLMTKYNKQDVILLEKIYLRMLPWTLNHPNYNVYDGTKGGCPNCGSNKIQRRGFSYTQSNKYQQFACLDCRNWFRGKVDKKLV